MGNVACSRKFYDENVVKKLRTGAVIPVIPR